MKLSNTQRDRLFGPCLFLAELISTAFALLYSFSFIFVPKQSQMAELERGCDILIATPGRLKDFVDFGWVSLDSIKYLVFEETDRSLDMGFEAHLRFLLDNMTPVTQRQTILFSSTFPVEVQKFSADCLKDCIRSILHMCIL